MSHGLRDRKEQMSLDRLELRAMQQAKFNRLLHRILPDNRFYARKLAPLLGQRREFLFDSDSWDQIPFTTKAELVAGGDFAANLTWSHEHYVRFHRTSGTHGRPLAVLDSSEDWDWWCQAWQYVLDQADCQPGDRALMAFSFGPFIGFWSAFDAATRRGMLVAPAGGLSTRARLGLIQTFRPRVLFCTPSYAQHMACEALANQIAIGALGVEVIIVAGEPGGSVPATRNSIEQAWNARVVDHAGASEIGPWGFGDRLGKGVYVNEAEFIAEVIDRDRGTPVSEGCEGELVLTGLGRFGAPVIRYRTGDMVKLRLDGPEECRFAWLEGGVLGRADDMLIVRGVNVFPASIEAIVRSIEPAAEFRLLAYKRGAMDAMRIELEADEEIGQRIANQIETRVGLKVDVSRLPVGSLAKGDGKSRRFIDQR